ALDLIGDGKHRTEMERLAADLGLGGRVRFLGQAPPGQPIREYLDRADLFVLPSRSEGLPRAMVEAMARSLPCLGSNARGLPELLAPEDLVPAGNWRALAHKIREVLSSPERLQAMAVRNLDRSREYSAERLAGRRRAFLDQIRRSTAEWAAGRVGV